MSMSQSKNLFRRVKDYMAERKSAEDVEITGFKHDFDILKHQEVIDRT